MSGWTLNMRPSRSIDDVANRGARDAEFFGYSGHCHPMARLLSNDWNIRFSEFGKAVFRASSRPPFLNT